MFATVKTAVFLAIVAVGNAQFLVEFSSSEFNVTIARPNGLCAASFSNTTNALESHEVITCSAKTGGGQEAIRRVYSSSDTSCTGTPTQTDGPFDSPVSVGTTTITCVTGTSTGMVEANIYTASGCGSGLCDTRYFAAGVCNSFQRGGVPTGCNGGPIMSMFYDGTTEMYFTDANCSSLCGSADISTCSTSTTDTCANDASGFEGGGTFTALSCDHTITTSGNTFVNSQLNVLTGQSVCFNPSAAHNVVPVDSAGTCVPSTNPTFGTRALGVSTRMVFTAPGTYNYICTPHCAVNMTGAITVQAGGSGSSASTSAASAVVSFTAATVAAAAFLL